MKKEMLERYKILVDFLGKALGPDYEIVLQEVGTENSGIVAIANGEISGRTIGAPLTNNALKMIMQKQYETANFSMNYTGKLASGKTIRSSTMFIMDEGELVGLLCINFDDSRFHTISDTILKLVHPDEFVHHHYFPNDAPAKEPMRSRSSMTTPAELFQKDADDLMEDIFNEAVSDTEAPVDRLTQDERTELIAVLNDRGLFQLKGAVQFTSEKLACSPASIYRYLSKVKNG